MLTIRPMASGDRDAVMAMVTDFYHSPAVEHQVDPAILERAFWDAVDPAQPLIEGLLLLEEDAPVGYCYLTWGYASEMGGKVLIFDELYFKDSCRGKGYGSQVFNQVMAAHPECRRFRLEVTGANEGAARLYERLGFRFLQYNQMVLDAE